MTSRQASGPENQADLAFRPTDSYSLAAPDRSRGDFASRVAGSNPAVSTNVSRVSAHRCSRILPLRHHPLHRADGRAAPSS